MSKSFLRYLAPPGSPRGDDDDNNDEDEGEVVVLGGGGGEADVEGLTILIAELPGKMLFRRNA